MPKAKTVKKNALNKNQAQLVVDDDVSVLTLGKNRVEVSADGKSVIAYTNQGVTVNPAPVAHRDQFELSGLQRKSSTRQKSDATFRLLSDAKGAELNGVAINEAADGHLVITAPHGSNVVTKPLPETQDSGIKWINIGVSADTGRPLYVAPETAGVMRWKDANKLAAKLRQQGEMGARLPSERELGQIFNNSAALPGLGKKDIQYRTEFWSSTSDHFGTCAKVKCLRDGKTSSVGKGAYFPVRFVKS